MNPSIKFDWLIFLSGRPFQSSIKYSKAELQSAKHTDNRLPSSKSVWVSMLNCANLSCQSFSVRNPFLWESISANNYWVNLFVKLNPLRAFVFSRNTLNYSKSIFPIQFVISSNEI